MLVCVCKYIVYVLVLVVFGYFLLVSEYLLSSCIQDNVDIKKIDPIEGQL